MFGIACLLMSSKVNAQALWSCPSVGPVSIANPSNWSLSVQVTSSAYVWSDGDSAGIWSYSGGSGYSYDESGDVTVKFTNNTENLLIETAICGIKALSGANIAPTDAFSISNSTVNGVNAYSNAHGDNSSAVVSEKNKSTSFLVSAGPGQIFTVSGAVSNECYW